MRVGYIPESITYVCRRPEKKSTRWDSLSVDIKELDVIPAFAAQNEKALETARSWATVRNWRNNTSTEPYEEFESDNTPIKLQIVGLERRSEGGRAYKVITEHGYYFDLREDVLFDAIISVGIEKDGKMGGEYIWGVLGSQMRLIRNGSALHDSLKELTERKKKKKIPIRDLEPSGIYASMTEDRGTFIGTVYVDGKKKMFWYTNGTLKSSDIDGSFWSFSLKSSHSMVEKVGNSQVKLDQNLIDTFRKKASESALKSLDEKRGMYSYGRGYHMEDLREKRNYMVMTLNKKDVVEESDTLTRVNDAIAKLQRECQ